MGSQNRNKEKTHTNNNNETDNNKEDYLHRKPSECDCPIESIVAYAIVTKK